MSHVTRYLSPSGLTYLDREGKRPTCVGDIVKLNAPLNREAKCPDPFADALRVTQVDEADGITYVHTAAAPGAIPADVGFRGVSFHGDCRKVASEER